MQRWIWKGVIAAIIGGTSMMIASAAPKIPRPVNPESVIFLREEGKTERRGVIQKSIPQPDGSIQHHVRMDDTGEIVQMIDTRPIEIKKATPTPPAATQPNTVPAQLTSNPVPTSEPIPAVTPPVAPAPATPAPASNGWFRLTSNSRSAALLPTMKDRSADPLFPPGFPPVKQKKVMSIAAVAGQPRVTPTTPAVAADTEQTANRMRFDELLGRSPLASKTPAPAVAIAPLPTPTRAPTPMATPAATPMATPVSLPKRPIVIQTIPTAISEPPLAETPTPMAETPRPEPTPTPATTPMLAPMAAPVVTPMVDTTPTPVVTPMPGRAVVTAIPVARNTTVTEDVWMKKLLEAVRPSEREEAVRALSQTGQPLKREVQAALLATMQADPAPSVRATTIQCLAARNCVDPSYPLALQVLTTDNDPSVREAAKAALIRLTQK